MTGDEDSYILVLGSFDELSPVAGKFPFRGASWIGHFTGSSASDLGFDQPFEADVTLRYLYFSSLPKPAALARSLPGKVGLFWINDSEAGYVTDYNPCVPNPETDPLRIGQYLDCINGRACEKRE